MIGRIRGTLALKHAQDVLVDVGGVGYELQVPLTTLFELPEAGAEVVLATHMVVREDAQTLYGFISEQDRALFRQLIKVNGVGPKLALTILSGMDAASFAACIHRGDVKSLVALPGVGKRTAERLLLDMRDKLEDLSGGAVKLATSDGVAVQPGLDLVADAESALIALGYKPQEASRAVAAVHADEIRDSEELIRRALKSMVTS